MASFLTIHTVFFLIALVGCGCAAAHVISNPAVVTDCGKVIGTTAADISSWKGIPFAAAPVKERRWTVVGTLKEENQCWEGDWPAKKPGSMCPQFDLQSTQEPKVIGDEDCLFLNIFAPNTAVGAPVLVFSYGGSSTSGDAGMYDLSSLARTTKAVVVTYSYRLNVFGFIATKELSAADPRGTSGNYGLADSITALRWVQANIESFGGDPKAVSFFGQSSGGTQVLALAVSPHAEGLFRAGISMSGSPLMETSLQVAEDQNVGFVNNTGCAEATDVVACLRGLSTGEVFRSMPWSTWPFWSQPTQCKIPVPGDFQLEIVFADGDIVPKEGLRASLAAGKRIKASLVIGNMGDELELGPAVPYNTSRDVTAFLESNFDALLPSIPDAGHKVVTLTEYETLLRDDPTGWWPYQRVDTDVRMVCPSRTILQAATNASGSLAHDYPIYAYLVVSGPDFPMWNPYDMGGPPLTRAFHVWDLLTLINHTSTWDPDYHSGAGDIRLGNQLAEEFVSFAATGKPATVPWKPFPTYRTFSSVPTDPVVETDPRAQACDFWEPVAWPYAMKN